MESRPSPGLSELVVHPRPGISSFEGVLILEDDEPTREGLCGLLRDEGIDCQAFGSCAAGLEWLTTGRPRVILLDLQMPNLNGWEFLHLRDQSVALRRIPVIA